MATVCFPPAVVAEFETHAAKLREAARARREAVRLRAAVDDDKDAVAVDIRDTLGKAQPEDRFEGCTNLRTLRTLLGIIDDRGFERSPHQASPRTGAHTCMLALTPPLPLGRCPFTRASSGAFHASSTRRTGPPAGRPS